MPKVKSKSTAAKKVIFKTPTKGKEAPVSPEQRYKMIAEAAYFRAEKRGFVGGDVAQDWLDSEAEIDRLLQKSSASAKDEITTKQAFQKKLEAQLKEWDSKFAALTAKAQGAKTKIQAKIESEIVVLSNKRAAAQSTLRELRQRTGGAWVDLKIGAEKTWEEMHEALDRVISRFR
jgi:Protein of unknown function (DUF2934)